MATNYLAPTANFVQKTLNGSITDSVQTITLNNATNLQAPGVVVIDRTDANGTSTPDAREVVAYTGISGSDLTGCTRAFDNSTARTHSDGAIVETAPVVGMWNNLATIVASGLDSSGYLRAINSPVSIARIESVGILTSLISVNDVRIANRLEVSAASVTGIGLYPVWRTAGAISGATTSFGGFLVAPKVATFQWVSVVTRTVASGTSVVFDMKNNGTTIFPGVTAPTILAGGTYISTASIGTKALSPGNILTVDVKTMAAGVGVITDVTVQGGTL